MHASASSFAAPLILLPFDAATQAATHGSTHGPAQDQAAGLRALFARPCVRVLPVIVPSEHDQTRTVWLAKLAEAFARHGERTLVLDTVRAQVGAAFGLRARHDLEHALTGQCSLAAVTLDAAPGLCVMPAARALEALPERTPLAPWLARAATAAGCDLVLALLPAARGRDLPAGDALVFVPADRHQLAAVLADVQVAASDSEITGFRLLFVGLEPAPALTLAARLAVKLRPSQATLHVAGAARVARDLASVVRAAAGWNLASLTLPEREMVG